MRSPGAPSLCNEIERLFWEKVATGIISEKAVGERRNRLPLIHHSDRGAQYCSELYQRLHASHGVRCSMTDGYDCYQNALAERINGILKTEFLLHRPKNLADAVKMVDESVLIYNGERPHQSLKYKTPDAVDRAFRE